MTSGEYCGPRLITSLTKTGVHVWPRTIEKMMWRQTNIEILQFLGMIDNRSIQNECVSYGCRLLRCEARD